MLTFHTYEKNQRVEVGGKNVTQLKNINLARPNLIAYCVCLRMLRTMTNDFRYDPKTNEWKMRGFGKVKILMDPTMRMYRVVLRRERVRSVALNHWITKELEIMPMET